jgi:putative phosphonate transport system ATP-binding protein
MSATARDDDPPLLAAERLTIRYGRRIACRDVSFALWPGEVIGVVGESGSGKTTLLKGLSGQMAPAEGRVLYASRNDGVIDIHAVPEALRRWLFRTEWGFVHQDPRDGLRMAISAGGNIGEG